MKRTTISFAMICSLAVAGCSHGHHDNTTTVFYDRLTSLEVEVYDPLSNYVWENMAVRVVQVEHEWSGFVVVNPIVDDWFYTDSFGVVFFGSDLLGASGFGFLTDTFGRAVMSPDIFEDEAIVLLEIFDGFGSLFYEVDMTWDNPRVLAQVAF